jgi:hypothetical protein
MDMTGFQGTGSARLGARLADADSEASTQILAISADQPR